MKGSTLLCMCAGSHEGFHPVVHAPWVSQDFNLLYMRMIKFDGEVFTIPLVKIMAGKWTNASRCVVLCSRQPPEHDADPAMIQTLSTSLFCRGWFDEF